MISTTAAFDTQIQKDSRTFRAQLLSGTTPIKGEIKKITINKGACGEFTIGSVYSSYIEATLDNCEDLLENKELQLQIGLVVDGSVEYISIGYYTVTKPSRNEYQTTFTAVGRISAKLNCLPTLPGELTLSNLATAITEATGVPIICKGVTLQGTIEEPLAGLTCREILEVITAVLGGFATEDNAGNIVISKFYTADLVHFNGERTITDPEFSDYDYELTGVKVTKTEEWTDEDGTVHPEVSFTEGTPRQTLSMKYMTESLFSAFKANVVGYTYRPGTIPLALGDPRLEPWDCIVFTDVKGNVYTVPCLNIVHTFDGGLSTIIIAPGESESESETQTKGPLIQQLERMTAQLFTAEQAILKRITAYEADLRYATIASLTATDAKIETLEATDAKVQSIIGEFSSFKTGEFETLKSDHAEFKETTTGKLTAAEGQIKSISGDFADYKTVVAGKLEAVEGNIKTLETETLKTAELEAEVAKFGYLKSDDLEAEVGEFGYLKTDELEGKVGTFGYLKANTAALTYATISALNAADARINELDAKVVKTTELESEVGKFGYLKADELEGKVGTFGYLKASVLESEVAEFGYLKAADAAITYATIANLNTANANITNLSSEVASFKATVTQQFNAKDAEIEELKAKDVEIDNALIGKATITELNSVKGNVSQLTSDVAEINTLVNGNLTADNIQSLVISGSKFTVADGFITNAMIETLAFDKITGVDINTKNVTIHSDDGKSTWSDNTIQISDASRVRVQMGKDASGDYTLAVWDSTGKLIWDALGATENTIQRAIIKDAVVAADANIAGSKLDIESVITEVNGAETAILGTKIRLDEQKQTLQAAFTSLKSYTEGTRNITTSQQTSINAMQGQISTLISNTTITKDGQTVQLKDAYNTTVSDINSIKTTLGEHKSTIDSHTGSIQSVTTKANTIESDLSSTKQTISSVQSTLTSTQSRVSTVENDITGLKSRVSANETAISGKADGSVVTTLSGKVATFESTLDGFETALEKNYSKVTSKGEQLIVNGNGMLGDNTNFKSWVFEGAVGNNSPGSFTRAAGSSGTLFSDEYFLVSTNNTYTFSFDAKSLLGAGTMYSFIMFYDVDKKQIGAPQHMYHPGSTTTLAQDLKAGDTVIHLTDTSGWSTSVGYGFYLAIWNYKNSFGYTYPAETYTRNRVTLPKTSSNKLDSSCIDFTANTITLTSAYSGDTIPAGTPVSQGCDGGTYKYTPITGVKIPTEWTTYTGKVGGVDYSGTNKSGMFPPGVAYARIGFLWNYNKASGEQQWITNITVTDTTDVNELEEVVSNHETRIAAAEGQILLKVSTSDFNSYKNTVTSDIATAKSGAISAAASDATTKANKALSDAKAYTTAEITTVNKSINSTNQEISVMKGQIALKVEQSNIDTAVTNVKSEFAETLKSYSTTSQMNTAITAETGKISSKVSSLETSVNTVSTTLNDNKASWDKAVTDSAKALTDSTSALLKHDVQVLASNMKAFKNVCTLTANGNSTGYLVITTPILPSRMVSVSLKGYIYSSTNETVDLTIGFYNYGNSMPNTGYVNKGSFDVSEVKVGKVSASDTRAVIIIGTSSTKWAYPKLVVEEVIVGHSNPPDSYKDGFSMAIVSALPDTYAHLTTVSGSDFKAELTTTKSTVADHTVSLESISGKVTETETNITTINGQISSIENKVSSAEQKITADAITSVVRAHSNYQSDLAGKVATNNVISCINQSAEAITINAAKLNLSGVVTITAFNSEKTSLISSINNAQSAAENAQESIDNLSVGGRNLLKPTVNGGGNCTAGTNYNVTVNTKNSDTYFYINLYEGLVLGETYTLSFKMTGLADGEYYDFKINNNAAYGAARVINAGRTHVTFTVDSVLAGKTQVLIDDGTRSVTSERSVSITELKLEKGNTVTDWTPAPEDLTSRITTAQTTANSASSNASAANSVIANWCYNNNTTYIDGGKIYAKSVTASQIDVENLFAQEIAATGSITGMKFISSGTDDYGYPSNMTLDAGELYFKSEGIFTTIVSGHHTTYKYDIDNIHNYIEINGNFIRHSVKGNMLFETDAINEKVIMGNTEVNGTLKASGNIYEGGTALSSKYFPLSGGTLSGNLVLNGTEQFKTHYIKKVIGSLDAGTAYANLASTYKDGTYHRMWRLRFPASCNFWGKIKVTLYGTYSSFNASGVMSKSITCNFNGSTIYNNVGCYDGLGVNVEKDFRISEAVWNSSASAWEILIWQKNLSGNNSPQIMIEAWAANQTFLNNISNMTATAVELTQATSYTASKASSTGGTKTVTWADTPVYENPLGLEISTVGHTHLEYALASHTHDYLPKTTYEYNKELALGGSGAICIGKFKMYDSNITVEISSTTSTTYNGTLVIATQNYGKGGTGSFTASVYGDVSNTIAPNIYIYNVGSSGVVEVYFQPATYSKNLMHVQCQALSATPTDILTSITAVPSTATTKPTNLLKSALDGKANSSHTHSYLPLAGGTLTGDLTVGSASIQTNGYVTGTWLKTTANIALSSAATTFAVLNGGWIYSRTAAQVLSDIGALPLVGGTLTGELLISTGTTQSATKGIKWSAINSKNPYIGYATDQTDGTFVVCSLLGTNYASGLAIGGGSGNLLYKGNVVLDASNYKSYCPEINHTHSYLPLSGGTLTGEVVGTSFRGVFKGLSGAAPEIWHGNGQAYVNMTYASSAYYFKPGNTAVTYYNGGANYRWNTIYATNALNTSSDLRFKTDISKDLYKYVAMMDNIEPITFVRTNSPEDKRHIGYGAQDVEKALQIVGLENDDFAGLSKDWNEEKQDYIYGLTYEEFIPILHTRQNRDRREFFGQLNIMKSELRYVHQKLNAALDKIAAQEKEIEQLKQAS